MREINFGSDNVSGGGGFGGFGGGGNSWILLLFGLLFGEGGFGRGRDSVSQTEFATAINNLNASQRQQLEQITTQLGFMQNTNGQDKLSAQIESFKDLFVSLTQAQNLSNVQEFNRISSEISACCCATQASFAELKGKMDSQTFQLENRIEKASAANLLALERAQNSNDKRFDELARGQQDIECLIKTTSLEEENARLRESNHRYARQADMRSVLDASRVKPTPAPAK